MLCAVTERPETAIKVVPVYSYQNFFRRCGLDESHTLHFYSAFIPYLAALLSAFSNLSSPRSASSSVMTRGGEKRITESPQGRSRTPSLKASLMILSLRIGSMDLSDFTISAPIIRPRPRTSPMQGKLS